MPHTIGLTTHAAEFLKELPTDRELRQKLKGFAESEWLFPNEISRQSHALIKRLRQGFGLDRVLSAFSALEFKELKELLREPAGNDADRISELDWTGSFFGAAEKIDVKLLAQGSDLAVEWAELLPEALFKAVEEYGERRAIQRRFAENGIMVTLPSEPEGLYAIVKATFHQRRSHFNMPLVREALRGRQLIAVDRTGTVFEFQRPTAWLEEVLPDDQDDQWRLVFASDCASLLSDRCTSELSQKRGRGRPKGAGSYLEADKPYIELVRTLLDENPDMSDHMAVQRVVHEKYDEILGTRNRESLVSRILRRLREGQL